MYIKLQLYCITLRYTTLPFLTPTIGPVKKHQAQLYAGGYTKEDCMQHSYIITYIVVIIFMIQSHQNHLAEMDLDSSIFLHENLIYISVWVVVPRPGQTYRRDIYTEIRIHPSPFWRGGFAVNETSFKANSV